MNSIASHHVSELNLAGIAQIVSAANDIALVVDEHGIIQDVTAEQGFEAYGDAANWIGKPWIDTVTVESRPKIDSLLRTTTEQSPSHWRQVNLPSGQDTDIAILYRVFSVDETGKKIVMGRDLRALSSMQQELLDVQHSMEDDYARLYQAETRYRMLFQMSSEAILIIDAQGRNILEANPAASLFLDHPLKSLINKRFIKCFVEQSASEITQLLAGVRATGKGSDVQVRTRKGTKYMLHATLLRQDDSALYLVHLKEAAGQTYAQEPKNTTAVMDVIERSPDAFVVTDPDCRVLVANEAFMDLCQVNSDLQIEQQPLENWVGRPGVDVGVLRKNLQQRSVVRHYSTQINPQFGAPIDVELSAVAALQGSTPCFGFVIRKAVRRSKRTDVIKKQPLGRSLEQMTELVGRVPLKDLVRETTDLIERLCIDAALKMTSNNRASAADMLGLSRQSLYVKLRRFGITDSETDEDPKNP